MSTIQSDMAPGWDAQTRSRAERLAEAAILVAPPAVVFIFSLALYPAFGPLKDALLLALAGALFAAALAAGWLRTLPRTWAALVALYCAVTLAAWAASYRRDMGTDAALGMIAAPMLGCVAVAVVRRRMLLIEIIAATGAIEAVITLAQWLAGFDPHQVFYRARAVVGFIFSILIVRPIGTIGNSDVVALVIAASFPAALTLIGDRGRGRVSRLLWVTLAMADLGAIAGTACRASLVGALAGGSVVAVSRWTHLRRRTILTMLAIVCLLGAAFVAARVANRRNRLDLGMATTSRTFAWRVALARWPGSLLLGSGPGTFRFTYMRLEGEWLREHNFEDMRYAGGNADAQNDFLQARLETGWLGLAALVAVLAWWARTAIAGMHSEDREQRTVTVAALGGVLALVVVAMVETCFQYAATRMLIWLWMALPLTYLGRQERRAARFAGVRWALAAVVVVVFAWDAGRIVLSRYWTERGYRAEFAGRVGEAVEDDRRAAELDPANREARFHLGRAQWKTGDVAGAVRTLDDAVRCDAHPRVYEMRIRILYRSGRLAEALRRASEGVRIFPWAPELEYWREAILARMMTGAAPALPPYKTWEQR